MSTTKRIGAGAGYPSRTDSQRYGFIRGFGSASGQYLLQIWNTAAKKINIYIFASVVLASTPTSGRPLSPTKHLTYLYYRKNQEELFTWKTKKIPVVFARMNEKKCIYFLQQVHLYYLSSSEAISIKQSNIKQSLKF
jgi:hypothetical protein